MKLDEKAMNLAREKWNQVAKPLHSLGRFEELIVRLAGIYGSPDVRIDKRLALVMCGDHGVVEEGVTQTDSSVTASVAKALAEGSSNINQLAKTYHCDVIPVNMGIKDEITVDGLVDMKVAAGTKNMVKEPAMTKEEAKQAVENGMEMVKRAKKDGYRILVTGEMGIGNTTATAAIASVLLEEDPITMTGRGAGLSDEGLIKKQNAIKKAIAAHQPDKNDPMDVLAKVGGFDIAGMAGTFLGAAECRLPVIVDGVISAVAALLAIRINPSVKDYLLVSHVSKEPAAKRILAELGEEAYIHADMCLGEGTGAVMLLPLLDGVLSVYHSTHSFDSLEMDAYEELS